MVTGNALVLMLVCTLVACTTLQPIEDFSPSVIRQQVHVGDHVLIESVKGNTYKLTVTLLDDKSLHGTDANGKGFRVDYEAIRTIKAEEINAAGVAVGFGATLSVLAAAAFAVVIYSLSLLL